jgi:hypothetical protein
MKNVTITNIIIALIFMLSLNPVSAQNKTGTTIGQFLKIEPSSRIVAIGNAGAALSGEISSIFYNPASLGRLTGTDIQFTFNRWLADINYNYMAAGMNIEGLGTFSLIGTILNSGEIDVRTVDQPLGTGEKYSVRNLALGIGYGLMLTDRVSVGMQVNYITETIWHSSLSTFGMNFGVQYQVIEGSFMLGASVSNFGSRASYEGRDFYINYDFDPDKYGDNDQLPAQLRTDSYALPTIFRAGVSYIFRFNENYSILASVDAIHPNDNAESINIGGELNIHNILLLRGGFRNLFLENLEGGLVLGGGVKTEISGSFSFRLDYAYADYGRLAEAHRITLSLGLR